MDIVIRDAVPADRRQLVRIFLACRQKDFSWLPDDAMCVADFTRALEEERVFVAESGSGRQGMQRIQGGEAGGGEIPGGEILGFLTLWEPGRFIHFLFIHPQYQGNGIANRLVENLFAAYPLPYRLKCLDKNLRALEYYRREGWQEVGRGTDNDGGHRVLELDRRALKDAPM
jgi:GNAT superfamily N-acetyltransferase